MQTEVGFLGHIVGCTGLACDPEKLSAVRNWHEPNRVKAVRQFVGFVGYYRRFVKNFAYASRSLWISQHRYCTTRREMLAAVVMCTHFRSYLRGSQFTLRTDHSSLRWLQKFKNEDGMLARWYLLLGQFSVTFEYRPGSQHVNADGMSLSRTGPVTVASAGDRTVRYLRPICQQPT